MVFAEYRNTDAPVNRFSFLTENNHPYTLNAMKYGERLRKARDYAGLKQKQIADAVGIAQPSLSELETGDAQGSSYTVQFARICGVSPNWLADETGDMLMVNEVSEPMRHLLTRLSTMTEREQYRIVRMVDAFADDTEANDCNEPGHCGERSVDS